MPPPALHHKERPMPCTTDTTHTQFRDWLTQRLAHWACAA